MRRPDRGLEACGAATFLRADEIGLEDVGKFDGQPLEVRAERPGFLPLHRLPDVLEEAPRHRLVAIDDLAVELEDGADAGQAVAQQIVLLRREPACGHLEECGQRATRARGDERADFLLEPERMPPQPLAVGTLGDLVKRLVEEAREGLHRCFVRARTRKHQREVVAKLGQIPISGEEGGTQIQPADGVGLAARSLPRQIKSGIRLRSALHADVAFHC